jgi:hypothetical protein
MSGKLGVDHIIKFHCASVLSEWGVTSMCFSTRFNIPLVTSDELLTTTGFLPCQYICTRVIYRYRALITYRAPRLQRFRNGHQILDPSAIMTLSLRFGSPLCMVYTPPCLLHFCTSIRCDRKEANRPLVLARTDRSSAAGGISRRSRSSRRKTAWHDGTHREMSHAPSHHLHSPRASAWLQVSADAPSVRP